jgi:hypothetical protein
MKPLVAILILGGIAIVTFGSIKNPTTKAESIIKPTQQTSEEWQAGKDAWETAKRNQNTLGDVQWMWSRDIALVKTVRQSMKNPASFQLEQAIHMDDGTLCLTYRATNSFNAIVPGRTVIAKGKTVSSGESNFVPFWNKHCGGKTGTDISYIRAAI